MLRGTNIDESVNRKEICAADFASKFPLLCTDCERRREALALCSVCKDTSSNTLHIPMMDFRIESGKDDGQPNLLKEALKKLGQTNGVLLDSGKSYHYYGFQLLAEHEWRRFMAISLLLEPLVDVR